MNSNPKELGFRMGAEWENHEAVWLAWPYDTITFGSLNEKEEKINTERLGIVENIFREIIKALTDSEEVRLLKRDDVDYADVWTRDYLPTFVKNKENKNVAIKWIYNAYGEKFAGLLKDNDVWAFVNKKLNIETVETGVVLESGAIESNGSGVLITTEECMSSRNLSREESELIFLKYLGISKVIWLKKGLVNDHTDGHIDELARFVSPSKILCAFENDEKEENYERLVENFNILENAVDQNGNKFEIVKLPMPHMKYSNGKKAPASYTNFYISNKVVLAPTFKDSNDDKALQIIQSCFPERKVIPIDCSELIYGGGALHCITQQVPLN